MIADNVVRIALSVICPVVIPAEMDILISIHHVMTVVLMTHTVQLAINLNVKVVNSATTGMNNTATNAKIIA